MHTHTHTRKVDVTKSEKERRKKHLFCRVLLRTILVTVIPVKNKDVHITIYLVRV